MSYRVQGAVATLQNSTLYYYFREENALPLESAAEQGRTTCCRGIAGEGTALKGGAATKHPRIDSENDTVEISEYKKKHTSRRQRRRGWMSRLRVRHFGEMGQE